MKRFAVATWDYFNGAMDIQIVEAEDKLAALKKVHYWVAEFTNAEDAMDALFDSDQGVGVLEIQT